MCVLVAHLSDLHLRNADDLAALVRQLDRIVARQPAHVVITGDLLDRWDPRLLEHALDALGARGLLDGARLTILHGNHDLASSGGHPRRSTDLWRLALRFWDPPPLLAWRKRRFYDAVQRRADGVAAVAPFVKQLAIGWRIAVVDTVTLPWRPLSIGPHGFTVHHAIGRVDARDAAWLHALPPGDPVILLIHHFPLGAPQFHWTPEGWLRRVVREVHVPMAIPPEDTAQLWNAAAAAGTRLVLCGHVHRMRLAWKDGIAVGLNGQSGADWAGRSIAYYNLSRSPLEQVHE